MEDSWLEKRKLLARKLADAVSPAISKRIYTHLQTADKYVENMNAQNVEISKIIAEGTYREIVQLLQDKLPHEESTQTFIQEFLQCALDRTASRIHAIAA